NKRSAWIITENRLFRNSLAVLFGLSCRSIVQLIRGWRWAGARTAERLPIRTLYGRRRIDQSLHRFDFSARKKPTNSPDSTTTPNAPTPFLFISSLAAAIDAESFTHRLEFTLRITSR